MSAPRHAEIAGAGFAGLAAALALRRHGWTVRVHEASHELRELGAGIFLWDNGIASLRTLGLADRVLAGAHLAPSSDVVVDGSLHSRQTTNTPDTYLMATMTRQHLYAAMLEAAREAGVRIVPGSRAVGADPAGRLLLADGSACEADLVVAADGVQSKISEGLGIACTRRSFDFGIVRTLVRAAGPLAGDGWRVSDHWVRAPRARRVLYVPCGRDQVYLALMAGVDDTQASAVPLDRALWRGLFPALAPLIDTIGDAFRYDVYRSARLASWSNGRIAIVGDAAHAMPPTLGQGAGFAIGNALALARALDPPVSVEAALATWESTARPATEAMQQRAEALAELGARRIDVPKSALATDATGHAMEVR